MKMSLVTDAVRRDAFAKVRNCKKHAKDEAILFKTVWQIIELANVARDGGLLALEEKIHERKEHDFISRLEREGLEQVIQGCDPDDVEELLTTMYWAKNPAGNKALAAYMMMRGICFIQAGVHPYVIEKILLAMLPQKYRGICIRQLEDAMEEYRENQTMRRMLGALISPMPLLCYTAKTGKGIRTQVRARVFAARWLRGNVRGAAALVDGRED